MSDSPHRANGLRPDLTDQTKNSVKPHSGGLASFTLGGIAALACLIGFGEFTIVTKLSANQGTQPESMTATQVRWDIHPVMPINFSEKRFVEANSEVPENPPDETSNFSFRDQQAAQLEPSPSPATDDTPEVKGEEETVKIAIAEEQTSPSQAPPPQPKTEALQDSENNLPPKQAISSETDLKDGKSEEGIHLKKSEEEGEDRKTVLLAQSTGQSLANREDSPLTPRTQRPRPKLSPELIRGPLMKSLTTAHRIGTVAIECRLHPYGVYLQEMLKAIEEQWHQLAVGSLRFLQKDRVPDTVTFRFTLLPTGKIEKIARLDSGKSSLPAELCRQAIASRVPFGIWTEEMIKDFGQSDEVTISFRYR
jgi:hypothetical protein